MTIYNYIELQIPGVAQVRYFSWWWAHICPKHVEKRNKHIKKICEPSWFYLQKKTGKNSRNCNSVSSATAACSFRLFYFKSLTTTTAITKYDIDNRLRQFFTLYLRGWFLMQISTCYTTCVLLVLP